MKTPWGDADQLRSRMLPAGRGTPPQVTEDSQRERLFGAMVATCAERGYETTTVADVIALAGVSRRDFYKHFDDKEACFLATLDEILTAAPAIVASRLRRQGSGETRAQEALTTLIALVVEQSAAARLCLVDAYAAGPTAIARVDAAIGRFRELAAQAFEGLPAQRGMPPEITAALVGGLVKMIHTRLHRGTESELVALGPQLLGLALSYRPPPQPLRAAPRHSGHENAVPVAPPIDPADRITRAILTVVARKGYPAATIGEIAAAAGVSLRTFYAHFDGKAAAFDSALFSGRSRLIGVALPVYMRARSWPEAVRAVAPAVLSFLASEPEFTRSIAFDVYAAGPLALERRDLGIEAAQRVVDDGAGRAPEIPAAGREAVISALYAMLGNQVQAKGPESLPELAPLATYTALCPFLGAEQACAVVNASRR